MIKVLSMQSHLIFEHLNLLIAVFKRNFSIATLGTCYFSFWKFLSNILNFSLNSYTAFLNLLNSLFKIYLPKILFILGYFAFIFIWQTNWSKSIITKFCHYSSNSRLRLVQALSIYVFGIPFWIYKQLNIQLVGIPSFFWLFPLG